MHGINSSDETANADAIHEFKKMWDAPTCSCPHLPMPRNTCTVEWKRVTIHPRVSGTTGVPLYARLEFFFLHGHYEEMEYIAKTECYGYRNQIMIKWDCSM